MYDIRPPLLKTPPASYPAKLKELFAVANASEKLQEDLVSYRQVDLRVLHRKEGKPLPTEEEVLSSMIDYLQDPNNKGFLENMIMGEDVRDDPTNVSLELASLPQRSIPR